jgi:hypothetical protein
VILLWAGQRSGQGYLQGPGVFADSLVPSPWFFGIIRIAVDPRGLSVCYRRPLRTCSQTVPFATYPGTCWLGTMTTLATFQLRLPTPRSPSAGETPLLAPTRPLHQPVCFSAHSIHTQPLCPLQEFPKPLLPPAFQDPTD